MSVCTHSSGRGGEERGPAGEAVREETGRGASASALALEPAALLVLVLLLGLMSSGISMARSWLAAGGMLSAGGAGLREAGVALCVGRRGGGCEEGGVHA
jgi:hypothetical protein